MSRQFDEYMSDKFEIYGEQYSFIEPTNFEELMKAYEVRDIIQNYCNSLMHDDDSQDSWQSVLQEQEEYIQEYLDSLGEFDNSCLIDNITYLAKKSGMRFGDLESAIGLSAGYISRTAKADSKKKMSIDVVWKIARLFEVDIKDLLEKDLRVPERGIAMLMKFVSTLKRKTVNGEIKWESDGGYMTELNPRFANMGLVTENEDDLPSYHPDNLNQNINWVLMNEIYVLKNFNGKKDLAIVSFADTDNDAHRLFDFLLIWQDGKTDKWERVFCTADDVYAHLSEKTADVVDTIENNETEPQLSREHRSMIEAFLKEAN